jgi:hypothetical protein
MKRIRFNLRLMLLSTALVAVYIVWLRARSDLHYSEWQQNTIDLKSYLAFEEERRTDLNKRLSHPDPVNPFATRADTQDLADVEQRIKEVKDRIEGTRPHCW